MSVLPFEPGPALARISRTPCGWIIDTRGPYGACHYDCSSEGEAAELAIILRDQGGWQLRYSRTAEPVRRLIEELSDGGVA